MLALNLIGTVVAMAIGIVAVFLTFKAKYVIERFLHKEPTEGLILRVKYVALALAVISFVSIFYLNK